MLGTILSTVKTGEQNQKKVVRNNHAKILWDFPIQTDKHLLHNQPDIVLINYKEKTGLIIDIAAPRDENTIHGRVRKNFTYVPINSIQ